MSRSREERGFIPLPPFQRRISGGTAQSTCQVRPSFRCRHTTPPGRKASGFFDFEPVSKEEASFPRKGRCPTIMRSAVSSFIFSTHGRTGSPGERSSACWTWQPGPRDPAMISAVCRARSFPLWKMEMGPAEIDFKKAATFRTSREPLEVRGREGSASSGTASPCRTK